jgi:flagellar motor switch protein FliN
MSTFLDCWVQVARDLFSQALAGEPELLDSLPRPFASGSFGFLATVAGDREGGFAVEIDSSILEAPLLGDGVEQKGGWKELLREICDAAAGELLARTGTKCSVVRFEESTGAATVSRAFQLKAGARSWTVLVRDQLRGSGPGASPLDAKQLDAKPPIQDAKQPILDAKQPILDAKPPILDAKQSRQDTNPSLQDTTQPALPTPPLTPGFELLLDVELEASLRFGCREMPLGEILDLGPGDVVQLDRHVSDPVDLIVGDKIVARGEVILLNGNFGLRVSEVAAPRKRLESIRCLF